MKYKVHISYINTNGTIISEGIYNSSDIDIAEARNKSIVTSTEIEIEKETLENLQDIKQINIESESSGIYNEFNIINLNPELKTTTLNSIDINKATEKELAAIKYVSKSTARKVINERNMKVFSSYVDLDTRVPLSFNKKWQDVCHINFYVNKNIASLVEFI